MTYYNKNPLTNFVSLTLFLSTFLSKVVVGSSLESDDTEALKIMENYYLRLLQDGTGEERNDTDPPSPADSNNGNSSLETVIIALGITGFVLFLVVLAFLGTKSMMDKSKKPPQDTTGGVDLVHGHGKASPSSPSNPLGLANIEGNRDSMSTIFSQDRLSLESGQYSGKIEAQNGKDENLMGFLRIKREEHNDKKKDRGGGKKRTTVTSSSLAPSNRQNYNNKDEKSMQEMDASTVDPETEI